LRGSGIVENGKVVQVAVIPGDKTTTSWESTDPWLRFVRIRNIDEN